MVAAPRWFVWDALVSDSTSMAWRSPETHKRTWRPDRRLTSGPGSASPGNWSGLMTMSAFT
jgi:hypothetical protein